MCLNLSQVCQIDIVGEPLILAGVQGESFPQPVELEGEVYGATDDAGTEHSLQNIHLGKQLNISSL